MSNQKTNIKDGFQANKKIIMLASLMAFTLFALFVYIATHSHMPVRRNIAPSTGAIIQNDIDERMLYHAQVKKKTVANKQIKTAPKQSPQHIKHEIQREARTLSDSDFDQASQSSISVYYHDENNRRDLGIPVSTSTNHEKITLAAGTLIQATLVTGINSDLPGSALARVSQDVYGNVDSDKVMIPQGATLIGKYEPSTSADQSRVMVTWSELFLPSGKSIALNNEPSLDLSGVTGLSGKVHRHILRNIGSTAIDNIANLTGAVAGLVHPGAARGVVSSSLMDNTVSNAVQHSGMQQRTQVPTITIEAGKAFTILLHKSIDVG